MKTKLQLFIAYHETKQYFSKIRILFTWFKLQWNKLYIRKDEFHSSLDMDGDVLMFNKDKSDKYMKDLIRRRNIAHRKSL